MNTRKANKIIRSLANGNSFEKSLKISDKFDYFDSESQAFILYYEESIRYCIIENDFAYFYGTYNKTKFFECNFYASSVMDSNSFTNDYVTREQKLKFVSKFMKNKENLKYFESALQHLEHQTGVSDKIQYRYDTSNNNHILKYSIDTDSKYIALDFVFSENSDQAVGVFMNYKNGPTFLLHDGRDFNESLINVIQKDGTIRLFSDPDFDRDSFMSLKEAVVLNEIIEY